MAVARLADDKARRLRCGSRVRLGAGEIIGGMFAERERFLIRFHRLLAERFRVFPRVESSLSPLIVVTSGPRASLSAHRGSSPGDDEILLASQ